MSTAQGGEKRKQFKFKLKYKNIFIGFVLFFLWGEKVKTSAVAIAVCPCIFYPLLPAYELCTNEGHAA